MGKDKGICECSGFQEQYFSGNTENVVIDKRCKYALSTARCLLCGRVFSVAPKVARCLEDSQVVLSLDTASG